MATKKEIKIAKAKAKAIDGGFTPSVADNVFAMQMGSKEVDTPTTFSTKDQGVMAMSTMYQTKDSDGTRPKVDPITSNLQIAGAEPITATQVSTGFSGGGVFENQDQKNWYDNQIAQRIAAGMTQDQAIQDYRNTFKIGEEQFKTVLSGGETKYADNPFGAFSQGLDDVVSADKKKTGGGSTESSGSGGDGMIDTFTSYDTRQARRKGIVEGRGIQQAARDVKQQQRKTDRLGRKDEKQLFKDRKKEARQERRQARKDLNQAKRQNRQDKRSTRDAFSTSPNISGSAGFGLKSGMVSSNRSVADARARLDAAKSNLKSTRKNKPLTAAEQRRSRKKTFQDTKTAQSQKQLQKARDIEAQGELQRKAMKNPRTTKEFATPMLMNKKMSFRK